MRSRKCLSVGFFLASSLLVGCRGGGEEAEPLAPGLLAYPIAPDNSSVYTGAIGVFVVLSGAPVSDIDSATIGASLASSMQLVVWPSLLPVSTSVGVVSPASDGDYFQENLSVVLTPTVSLASNQWYAVKVSAFPAGVGPSASAWFSSGGAWYARFIGTSSPRVKAIVMCDSQDPTGNTEMRVYFNETIETVVDVAQAALVSQNGVGLSCSGAYSISSIDERDELLLTCPALSPVLNTAVSIVPSTVRSSFGIYVGQQSLTFVPAQLPNEPESSCRRLDVPL